MFGKIRARIFKTENDGCVARHVKSKLHVDDVFRPLCRERLAVKRLVYREGETFCARKFFSKGGHFVKCLAFQIHSESVGEIVPSCKRHAAFHANDGFCAVRIRFAKRRLRNLFAVTQIKGQRHGGCRCIAVFKVESKRSAHSLAVVKICRCVHHKVTCLPRDRRATPNIKQVFQLAGFVIDAAVRDLGDHCVRQMSACNFSCYRLVGVNHGILDFGRVKLVAEHCVEYACHALWEIKLQIGVKIGVVLFAADHFVGVDLIGQLADILRAVARNESCQKDGTQNQNQN